jgi:hypothetical protein
MRFERLTEQQEFASVVRRLLRYSEVNEAGCWIWTGSRYHNGYGRISSRAKHQSAHRTAYRIFRGPIKPGLQLDHLCRERGCVNPLHLEPVTNRENTLRGEAPSVAIHRSGFCSYGHPMSGANLVSGKGWRDCRECRLRRQRKYRQRG